MRLRPKAEALREQLALAAMPVEFTQIESSAGLSREQLAALVGVRLDQSAQARPAAECLS